MKRPEEFIQINKKRNITTLEDAIRFKNDMVSKYGNEAKDDCNYIIDYCDGGNIYICFETVLPNLNYKQEMEEWEKTGKFIAEKTIANREKEINKLNEKITEYSDKIKNNPLDLQKVKHYTEQVLHLVGEIDRLTRANLEDR